MFTLTIEDKHGGIADEYSFEKGDFLVGRSHTADIILPSDNVSRRHARVYTANARCYIEDLGSSNGVFVNGRRLHEVYEVEGSAQVKIGDYYLHIKSDAAPRQEAKVYCRLHGQNLAVADQTFKLTRTANLIGRGKDCTVTIIDPSVSRIHAKLTVDGDGGLQLEDLKSSNGTFVNDERIELSPVRHLDRLRFGNVEVVLERPDLDPAEAGAAVDAEGPGVSDLDEPWQPGRGSNRGLWVGLSLVTTLLVVGVILVSLFGKEWFQRSPPAGMVQANHQAHRAGTMKAEKAKAPEVTRAQQIATLSKAGRAQIKDRRWAPAIATWHKVLDKDPLNREARQAINRIEIWQRQEKMLTKAKALAVKNRYGAAAKLVRGIDDASIYFPEARTELLKLMKNKASLIEQADHAVASRQCARALALYEQVKQLDPTDTRVASKIAKVKRKARHHCR